MTSKITYNGDLRTTCEHINSGTTIITDAPVDNHGKGEAFSPTDTLATALASCMLTIMGIKANEMNVGIEGSYAEVTKHMESNPRRVSKIDVEIFMTGDLDEKSRKILENSAKTCPVLYSLHPDIEKKITFNY